MCVGAEWSVELPCTAGAAVLVDESALKKAHDWPGNQFCEDRLNTDGLLPEIKHSNCFKGHFRPLDFPALVDLLSWQDCSWIIGSLEIKKSS